MPANTHVIDILYDGTELYLQDENGNNADYIEVAPTDQVLFRSTLNQFELDLDKSSMTPAWDLQKQGGKKLESSRTPVGGYYVAQTGPMLLLYKYSVKVKGGYPKLDPDIQIVDDVKIRPRPALRSSGPSLPAMLSVGLGIAAIAAIAGLLSSRGRQSVDD
jgi:hypothetical protein